MAQEHVLTVDSFKETAQSSANQDEITGYQHSQTTPLLTHDQADRQSFAFGKAAFAFRDRLTSIRRKRDSAQTLVQSPNSMAETDTELANDDGDEEVVEKQKNRVRILRAVQGLLTASLSILIAVFQGRAYVTYLKTKDIPDAWPKTPALAPTLLLLGVALAAFAFDIFMLVAYLTPDKGIAATAYRLADKAHYFITSAKTFSYGITAIVCRAGFSFGNSSGTNMDLWSWSCSSKGENSDSETQVKSNCTTQTLAWIFALLQILIEMIGAIISLIVARQNLSVAGQRPQGLPQRQQREKLDSMYEEVDMQLNEIRPSLDY